MTPASQPLEALALANTTRFARAAMKREVKAGERKVSDLLREHPVPDWLASMLVEDLLNVTPRFHPKAAREWILELPAKGTATVGDLTYRKRRILADRVAEWEGRGEKRKSSGRSASRKTFGTGSGRKWHSGSYGNAKRVA